MNQKISIRCKACRRKMYIPLNILDDKTYRSYTCANCGQTIKLPPKWSVK